MDDGGLRPALGAQQRGVEEGGGPHPALPQGPLGPPQRVVAGPPGRPAGPPVVPQKQEDAVLVHPAGLQGGDQLAHRLVHSAGHGLQLGPVHVALPSIQVLEALRGLEGGVGRLHGEVEEERRVRRLRRVRPQDPVGPVGVEEVGVSAVGGEVHGEVVVEVVALVPAPADGLAVVVLRAVPEAVVAVEAPVGGQEVGPEDVKETLDGDDDDGNDDKDVDIDVYDNDDDNDDDDDDDEDDYGD